MVCCQLNKFKKPELLAPAGNLEKLKTALFYGADAVYIGLKNYSLRARESEFEIEEAKKAVKIVHDLKKKIYLAVNIFASNSDLDEIKKYLKIIKKIRPDALIISDPSMISLCKEVCPKIKLHLSTQANVNNFLAVNFWKENGIRRINLAREMSLREIKEIRKKSKAELEIFIHGAMCMAYSGRCNLSYYMAGRSANMGLCAHPCRWEYHLIEEKRPGQKFIVEEDKRGSYIFNSKDLCMIEYVPELMSLNLDSWKIEGRMKTSYYLAVVIKAYKEAVNKYLENPKRYKFSKEWLNELKKVSYRGYCTGFYLGELSQDSYNYDDCGYIQAYRYAGIIEDQKKLSKKLWIRVKNKIEKGNEVELIMPPGEKNIKVTVGEMVNPDGKSITTSKNGDIIGIDCERKIPNNVIIRMKA